MRIVESNQKRCDGRPDQEVDREKYTVEKAKLEILLILNEFFRNLKKL